MPSPTVDTVALADAQRELERQLEERLAVIQELAPFALPSVDPVTCQTAASHRLAVEQITAALNRIAQGTYGRCSRCGRQIPPARLEVLPHADTCIECQSHAEAA
ncbi:TraR/DksA C4-type zinc finger protein [Microbacterium sp. NEAU-LLC]|uniref:TraR/DksA C4-type zinc finger protein n=1 Tax=Microbacterium helvum TaxID=2773713 RepID=A0ABR8NPT8_9MICO|nr:TraR/DksA C4-type zinc finger protein [Microbacterium helvum]MBD3942665.1 TraR/DksA C4-type zinc finger protein [Microbacterium helvum]